MYELEFTQQFIRISRKYKRRDKSLKIAIEDTLEALTVDPKNPTLRSHKVSSRLYGECWSSRVTGDLRIIWQYAEGKLLVITVLDLGSHSGSKKAYQN